MPTVTNLRFTSSVEEMDALPTGSVIAEISELDAPAIACKDRWGFWRFSVENERAWSSAEIQDGRQKLAILYVPKSAPHSGGNNQ